MAKRKVYKTVKGFAYMIIGCGLMLTLFNSAITVFQRQDEIAVLEKEKKAVEKEKKALENEISLLNDDAGRRINKHFVLIFIIYWR